MICTKLIRHPQKVPRFDSPTAGHSGYTEYGNLAGPVLFYFHVAIASNESFPGWMKTFTDPRLCAAIVDRLTFGAHIMETGTDSHRLARSKAVAAAR